MDILLYIISNVYIVHYNNRSTCVMSTAITCDDQLSSLDYGFYWCRNFCLGKKWRSSQAGEEKYQDMMLADFRASCVNNNNNRSVNFWNELNDLANEKINKKQQKSSNDN